MVMALGKWMGILLAAVTSCMDTHAQTLTISSNTFQEGKEQQVKELQEQHLQKLADIKAIQNNETAEQSHH